MGHNKNAVSVIIHTRNEGRSIEDCIKSAKFLTSLIVVVDMESEDDTVEIAKKNGATVHAFPPKNYVEPSREFGIEKAPSNWVFILDSDERMTEELAREIKNVIVDKSVAFSYYKVPRKNIFAGKKWLKHGGWWPDLQPRLIKKEAFESWPKQIHSSPRIRGAQGVLKNPFLHYFHGNLESMVEKTIVYENIEADLLHMAGKKSSTLIMMRKFLGELFRRLIKGMGFLDGSIGIIESIYQAFSKTITYLYLYEKSRSV